MKHIGYILSLTLLCLSFSSTSATAKVMSKYDHSSLLKAVEDYRFNDLETATKTLESLHQRFPNNLRVMHYLGLTYQESMKYKQAITMFERWLEASKDKTSEKSRFAWMGISRSHIGLKNYWEAVRSIKRWLRHNKQDIQAQIMLGDVLIRAEAFGQAKKVWQNILDNKNARRSQHAAAWYYKAWSEFLNGDLKKVKVYIGKSLALDAEGAYATPARNLLTTPPAKRLGFIGSASAETFYNSNVVLQPDNLQTVSGTSDMGIQGNVMLGYAWRKFDVNYIFSATVHQDYSGYDLFVHALSGTWTNKAWSFTPSYENISLNKSFLYQGFGLGVRYNRKGWSYAYTGKLKTFTTAFGNLTPVDLTRLGGTSHVLSAQKGINIKGINTVFSSTATSELTKGDASHNQTDSYLQLAASAVAMFPISDAFTLHGTVSAYSRQYSAADVSILINPASNTVRSDINTAITTSTIWKPWKKSNASLALNISYQNNTSNYASGTVADELSKSYSAWKIGGLASMQW